MIRVGEIGQVRTQGLVGLANCEEMPLKGLKHEHDTV